MSRPRIVLVDGHSLAYRAFHALPPDLKTSKGEPTNAVYGFASMLLSVLADEKPEYAVVTFDKGPSFRVRDYAGYKAHRARMPEEMQTQMARVRELVAALALPAIDLDDYEADDLLGTLSRQAEEAGLDVLIVTGDRDALQLVDEHITVLTSGRRFDDKIYYTPAAVKEKYGLVPAQLVDLKALMGDASDAIPGVAGVGEKGAVALLQQYRTLEGIYEHLDELAPRYRKALEAGRESARLSRHLARIVRDAPVTLDQAAARRGPYDRERLLALLRELEFRSLLNRLPELGEPAGPRPAEPPARQGGEVTGAGQLALFGEELLATPPAAPAPGAGLGDYRLVGTEADLAALVATLRVSAALPGALLVVDTETTSTDSTQAELVGISLSDREGVAWYLPLRAPAGEPVLPLEAVRQHLGPLLADPALPKAGHNLKFDLKVLQRAGLPLAGLAFDPLIAEWVLNPASPNLGLKNLAWARLGVKMTEIHELIGRGKEQRRMDAVPLKQVVPYAGADADMTRRLVAPLKAELEQHQQTALFRDLELPLIPVLAEIELTGVKLDLPYLERLSGELAGRLAALEQEIYRLAGGPFNVNSTQQLSTVLFTRLGLSTRGIRKTQSGHYSTDAEVLERLRGMHPVVDLILEHRSLSKLKSTYVDALPQLVNPATGRVHTSYNQTGTVTGRISSSDPNLQNIPIRTEEGRRVRRAFIAEEGWVLVGADYSQVELRIMAHVSGDEGLLAAFARGEDIHATTAAAVYAVPLAEVTSEMRRVAKAVNFGLIYGQGAYGLAAQIGVTPEEADSFIRRYFERFPQARAYMERLQREAEERGYVETLLGRRRYFPELAPGSRLPAQQRQAALRMAINAPIQGTAADLIKLAMLRLRAGLRQAGLRARMILQVHDELVLEAPREEVESVIPLIREAMERAFTLAAPLKVDVEVGPNWEEMA